MDDHATPTRRSVAERASLALAFAIPLLMLGLGLWTGAFDHPQKDTALAELYTRHAARGDLLLGPYSRFGWHHPGPLLYYLYALPYQLFGQAPAALFGAAVALSLVASAGIVRSYHRLVADPRARFGLYVLLAALHLVVVRQAAHAPHWNPVVPLLPFAWMLLVGVEVARGRAAGLPLLALLHALVVQCHVGFAPVATLALVAAVTLALRRPHGQRARPWVLAGLALALAWAPVAAELVTRWPGNPGALVSFFLGGGHAAAASLSLSETLATAAAQLAEPAPLPPVAAAVVIVSLLAVLVRHRREPLATAALTGLAAAGVTLLGLRGPALPHVLLWAAALGWLAWLAAATALLPRLPLRLVSTVALLAGAALAAGATWHLADTYRNKALRDRTEAEPVARAAAYLSFLRDTVPDLTLDLDHQPAMRHGAAVLLALDRADARPRVTEAWARFLPSSWADAPPSDRLVEVRKWPDSDGRVLFTQGPVTLQTNDAPEQGLYTYGDRPYLVWRDEAGALVPASSLRVVDRAPAAAGMLTDGRVPLHGAAPDRERCLQLAPDESVVLRVGRTAGAHLRIATSAGTMWRVETRTGADAPWQPAADLESGPGLGVRTVTTALAGSPQAIRMVAPASDPVSWLCEVAMVAP